MLRAAIVEKSKEHREYIRASLTGINMDIQVSEYADEYDYLDDLVRMRLLLIFCC